VIHAAGSLAAPTPRAPSPISSVSGIHAMPPLHFDLAVWMTLSAVFFTSMPWLVNLWFRRGYARHLLQPLARAHSV
jgi:hypothetical protein